MGTAFFRKSNRGRTSLSYPLKPSPGEVMVEVRTSDICSHPQLQTESLDNSPNDDCQAPTNKEVALAEAARARLYGNRQMSNQKFEANGHGHQQGHGNRDPMPVLPTGREPAAVDVCYLDRSDVHAIEGGRDVASDVVCTCLAGLESKDWLQVVQALNQMRQLSIHHTEELEARLDKAVPLVLNQVKSLRSSVCKTALLCLTDLIHDLGDALLPSLDGGGMSQPAGSLLCQLLLKASSNDKRFVIEEADRCLRELCGQLSPAELQPLFTPYVQHRNPRVRANAGSCMALILHRLGSKGILAGCGLAGHLRSAGYLITDKTPQAREAARAIVAVVHSAFEECPPPALQEQASSYGSYSLPLSGEGGENSERLTPWEVFCREELGITVASAVLKADA